jgi:hypothetical protein
LTAVFGAMLLMIGCTPTTTVNFSGPPGSVLHIDDKSYDLPATVELARPCGSGGAKRYDASFAFTPAQSQEIRAEGYIDVFGYEESDNDKDAVNQCVFDEAQWVMMVNGTTVVFTQQSVGRQPLYDLALSKK